MNQNKLLPIQTQTLTRHKGDHKWKAIIDFVRDTTHGKNTGNQLPTKGFVELKDTTNSHEFL